MRIVINSLRTERVYCPDNSSRSAAKCLAQFSFWIVSMAIAYYYQNMDIYTVTYNSAITYLCLYFNYPLRDTVGR